MYARHVTVKGDSSKVDEAVSMVRDRVLPVLEECEGFKGQLLLIDRDRGEASGISLWDTEENLRASEDRVSSARQDAADSVDLRRHPK
jgi:hypothetical protein